MAAIIAFMIAIGVITTSDQATPELIEQYEQEYQESIIIEDMEQV